MADRVFGCRSLVNGDTHAMAPLVPARLPGWRRVRIRTPLRPVPFLSVEPLAGGFVAGVLAPVADWPALDLREAAYLRHRVTVEAGGPRPAQVCAVPAPGATLAPAPLLLVYVETVAAGFAQLFGPGAIAAFVATTHGWDAPLLDDRAAPRYPRFRPLSTEGRAALHAALAAAGARIIAAG